MHTKTMQPLYVGFIVGIFFCIITVIVFNTSIKPSVKNFNTSANGFYPQSTATQSTIDIYAAGQPALGIYPTMVLVIHGTIVKIFPSVEGNYKNYRFEKFSYTGLTQIFPSDVEIHFTNDYYDPQTKADRNLYVEKIVIDGHTYTTEAPTTFSSGGRSSSQGCSQGYLKTDELECNGYFQYNTPLL